MKAGTILSTLRADKQYPERRWTAAPSPSSTGGTYAAKPDRTVKTSDKRFINYGVDLGTRISTNLDSHSDNVRESMPTTVCSFSRTAQVQKKSYAVHNVDARAKMLIIEHPCAPDTV